MNIKQQNLNPVGRTIVASRLLGTWAQLSRTGQRFVARAAESMLYPPCEPRVAQPEMGLVIGGSGRSGFIADRPGHSLRA